MALNFPSSPTNGQTFTVGNRSWIYNSTLGAWEGGAVAVTPSSLGVSPGADVTIEAINVASTETTPVDGDFLPMVKTSAGNTLRRLSFLNSWLNYFKGKADALYVGITGNQTVAGDKTFSGQMELTTQAATNSTSAMTRGLMLAEEAFNASFWQFGVNTAAGNSGTGSSASRSGSAASGWGRTLITSNAMRAGTSGGITLRSDIPLAVSVWGSLDVSSTVSGAVVRIIIGDPGNAVGTPPRFADQNALIARGFGAEVYYSIANSRQEIRLFAHDGTTYSTSSGAAFPNSFTGTHTLLVSSDGLGNIKLFAHTTGSSFTNLQRPTLLQTLSGGPSGSSSMGGSHITSVCVNHSTVAPISSDVLFSIIRSKIVINATI